VHHRFRTPYIAIILFCLIATLVLTPGFFATNFFADLGALYVFGSLLCFALAHAAILALRMKKPEMPRPFKLGWNIRFKGQELPMTAILGLITTSAIWIIVIITQPYSRWLGMGWLVVGLIIYSLYRWKAHLPLTHLPKKPEEKIL
jgi:APA family basic amino acid/polyamine antiporter